MGEAKTATITVESASLVTRLSIASGIVGIVLALLVLIFGVFKADFAGSDSFVLALIPLAMVILFSVANFIYGLLAGGAAQEAAEKILLAKRKENHALNVEEDVRFTAERSFANYTRYAPYVLSALGALGIFLLTWAFWRYFHVRLEKIRPVNSLQAAFVAAVMMAVCVFLGAFFIGQARAGGYRWLRSAGSWLVTAFVTFAVAAVALVMNHFGIPGADTYVTNILLVLFLVLGAEFVINFVIEFYRPRTIVEERPVFESRLLALFTEPGGVMRNIADMLDYQFGFKVSGTWIYAFIERALYPLIVFWVVILWLASSVYEVGPNQVGFKESFGRVDRGALLQPGIYFGLPWPFGQLHRYSCTEIHQVVVGGHEDEAEEEDEYEDDGHGHAPAPKRESNHDAEVITWTTVHSDEEHNFIVASDSRTASIEDNRAMQLALMVVDIPVQYRIRPDGVFQYACDNANAPAMLKQLSEAVVVEYLAGTTLTSLLANDRRLTEKVLQERIQQVADSQKLGVEIINVNLLGLHPPVKEVAPEFEKVVSAMESAHTEVLAAKTYAADRVPAAQSEAARIISEAQSYRHTTVEMAKAESHRFGAQLTAYQAMPEMFKLRAYLDFLKTDCARARKYVLSSSLENNTFELNFEVNPQLRLLDAGLQDIKREQ